MFKLEVYGKEKSSEAVKTRLLNDSYILSLRISLFFFTSSEIVCKIYVKGYFCSDNSVAIQL